MSKVQDDFMWKIERSVLALYSKGIGEDEGSVEYASQVPAKSLLQ